MLATLTHPLTPSLMFRSSLIVCCLAVSLFAVTGCGERGAPQPKALTADQITGSVPEVFKGAPAEVAQLAADVVDAIGKQDFTTAWDKLQTLNASPGLSDAQKDFVASSIASVGAEVQKAEGSGDEAAQQALEFHRANK